MSQSQQQHPRFSQQRTTPTTTTTAGGSTPFVFEKDLSSLLEQILNPYQQTVQQKTRKTTPLQTQEVYETETSYIFEVDVPSFTREDLSVVYDEETRTIRVSGEKTSTVNGYTRNRKVSTSYKLPQRVDLEHIEAKLDNGVLYVVVPKSHPSVMTITIQ